MSSNKTLCAIFVLLPVVISAAVFVEGYFGRMIVWVLLWPLAVLLWLAVLLGLVAGVGIALKRGAGRRPLMVALWIPVGFAVAWGLMPMSRWFVLGFREGVAKRVSVEELQEIAQVARRVVPEKESTWRPSGHRPEDVSPRWDAFVKEAPVDKLPSPFMVYNRGADIELEWGSALVGRWGIRIGEPAERKEKDVFFHVISPTAAVYSFED